MKPLSDGCRYGAWDFIWGTVVKTSASLFCAGGFDFFAYMHSLYRYVKCYSRLRRKSWVLSREFGFLLRGNWYSGLEFYGYGKPLNRPGWWPLRHGNIMSNLALPMPKKEIGKRCFNYNGASLWSNLPQEAKNSESLSSFKTILNQRICWIWLIKIY